MCYHHDSWYVFVLEQCSLFSPVLQTLPLGSAGNAIGYHSQPGSIAELYEDAPARQVYLEKASLHSLGPCHSAPRVLVSSIEY